MLTNKKALNQKTPNLHVFIFTYDIAKPSRFPPSPIVMYTGADRSLTGMQLPFVMLYATLDMRSCGIQN
jgi:hypothetical protein